MDTLLLINRKNNLLTDEIFDQLIFFLMYVMKKFRLRLTFETTPEKAGKK